MAGSDKARERDTQEPIAVRAPQSPRVASSGAAPTHGPTQAPERTQRHTGGDVAEPDVHDTVECAVLDADGVGHVLGVGRSTVYELDAREEIPAPIRVGRRRKWVRVEIEAWILHGAPNRPAWGRTWPCVRKEVLRR